MAKYEHSPSVIKAEKISNYFKKLAQLAKEVLPNVLTNHIELHNQTDVSIITSEIEKLFKVLKELSTAGDKEKLLDFLQGINPNEHGTFLTYLSASDDGPSLQKHLDLYGTHRDVNDMIIAVKKGVGNKLMHLCGEIILQVQAAQQKDKLTDAIIKKLIKYEFICKLSEKQTDILQLTCMSTNETLYISFQLDKIRKLIDIDVGDRMLPITIELLKKYSVIKCYEQDNEKILSLKSVNLSLKDALRYISSKKHDIDQYDEVSFSCTQTFYIDRSINWAGKNISITATQVVIVGNNLKIDVSGIITDQQRLNDSLHRGERARDGTNLSCSKYGDGDSGCNGKHGAPGMNGGSISIFTNEIVNSKNLILVSHGANGSDGQDGGHGCDGVAKHSIVSEIPDQYLQLMRSRTFRKKTATRTIDQLKEKLQEDGYKCTDEKEVWKSLKGNFFVHGTRKQDDVQILIGMINEAVIRHSGYLFIKASKPVNANGGNGGRGGQGGEGGHAGHIEIVDLSKNTVYHEVAILAMHGENGKPGVSGKIGKKQQADISSDRLVIYGFFNKDFIVKDIIQFKEWDKNDDSLAIKGRKFYCPPSISSKLESDIHGKHIGFYKISDTSNHIKAFYENCRDGIAVQQDQIKSAKASRRIDGEAILAEFEEFIIEKQFQVQGDISLSASYSIAVNLQTRISAEMKNLELAAQQFTKQTKGFKNADESNQPVASPRQLRHLQIVKHQQGNRSLSLCFRNPSVPANQQLLSENDNTFLRTPENSIEDKYIKIKEIMDFSGHELSYQEEQTTLLMSTAIRSTASCADDLFWLFEERLIPIIQNMTFSLTTNQDLDVSLFQVSAFLNKMAEVFSSKLPRRERVRKKIENFEIDHLSHCRWIVLRELHNRLISSDMYHDLEYQCFCISVHNIVMKQKSFNELKGLVNEGPNNLTDFSPAAKLKTKPVSHTALMPIEISCNTKLPLSTLSKTAIELLMTYINETERELQHLHFCIPNVIEKLNLEYETYKSTISDYELFFIMKVIQNAFIYHQQCFSKFQELFCLTLLEAHTDLASYEHGKGYLYFNGHTYKIKKVKLMTTAKKEISIQDKDKDEQHVLTLYSKDSTVMLDNENEARHPANSVHVSYIHIYDAWKEINDNAFQETNWHSDKLVKRLYPHGQTGQHNSSEDKRDKLKSLIKNYRKYSLVKLPYDVLPFDVFSFHPPSHWVEQLILHTVRTKISKHSQSFVNKIQKLINGLSSCSDKTLYCAFHSIILNFENDEKRVIHMNEQKEMIDVLETMKMIFIDRSVCSLVTKHGITENSKLLSFSESEALRRIDDLIKHKLIDCTSGCFLPDVTIEMIKPHDTSDSYFVSIFEVQKLIQNLSNSPLFLWFHKLYDVVFCLLLQSCSVKYSIEEFDKIKIFGHQIMRQCSVEKVKKLTDALFLVAKRSKRKAYASDLVKIFKDCAAYTWALPIVLKTIDNLGKSQSPEESLSNIFSLITSECIHQKRSQEGKQRTAKEIIDEIEISCHELSAKFKNVKEIVDEISADFENGSNTNDGNDAAKDDKDAAKAITDWATAAKANHKKEKTTEDDDHKELVKVFIKLRKGISIYYEKYKHTPNIVPRDNQMIAALLFCQKLSDNGTKLMQQIATGEGKTLIICMVAIYKALFGEKIDIVTSSSVLATRDATDLKPLYDMFRIKVAHCCHEDLTKRRQAYDADVIYGDIGSFQRDILETEFHYLKKIRSNRDYSTVIVDEVDSMLVDKGENMLYLPHFVPNMSSLDQIYLEIWSLVNAENFTGEKDQQEKIYDLLSEKIFGNSITPNLFCASPRIDEQFSKQIFQLLIDKKIIDDKSHKLLIKDDKKCLEIIKFALGDSGSSTINNDILMIIQQHNQEDKPLELSLPKNLHEYIKRKLRPWIQSATNAKYFEQDKEYIISIDQRESASDRYPKIIIMDNETGVEQESAEWGDGLHQFLQLKHNLRLTTESLRSVYMSNISFFKKYTNLMGVTGTLGSTEECSLFKKLYDDTYIVKIPTNMISRLQTEPPVCCSTVEEWESTLSSCLKEILIKQKRPSLLICEDKKQAVHLKQCMTKCEWFSHNNLPKVEFYYSFHQEKLEQKEPVGPSQLIIATNIAGRGTDIILNDEAEKNGGLYVLLAFLPLNIRVELQAYGRTARGGKDGTCKMIFFDAVNSHKGLHYCVKKRDLREVNRVSDIHKDYEYNIQLQEELFKQFNKWFDEIVVGKDKSKQNERRPYLDYALDLWAFFLDQYAEEVESVPKKVQSDVQLYEKEKERLIEAFNKEVKNKYQQAVVTRQAAMTTLGSDHSSDNVDLPPSRLMQLGHIYMNQWKSTKLEKLKEMVPFNESMFKKAKEAYKKAKQIENPVINPFALYYFASAKFNLALNRIHLLTLHKKEKRFEAERKLKLAFNKAIPLFQRKIRQCMSQVCMLEIANRGNKQYDTGGKNYFKVQKEHQVEMYDSVICTMLDIVGRPITTSTFDHLGLEETDIWFLMEMIAHDKNMLISESTPAAESKSDPLSLMLADDTGSLVSLYYSFNGRIKEKIDELLEYKQTITSHEELMGILPDKNEFWSILKGKELIKNVEVDTEKHGQMVECGYWNPKVGNDEIYQFFENWRIKIKSFTWIKPEISLEDRSALLEKLIIHKIIDKNGRIINFNLVKILEILDEDERFELHHKEIKDTLWYHGVYWFVLNHLLTECCEIELNDDDYFDDQTIVENNCTAGSGSRTNAIIDSWREAVDTENSVVQAIIKMNPNAHSDSPHEIQHITMPQHEPSPAPSTAAVKSQPPNDDKSKSARKPLTILPTDLDDHLPNELMNFNFSQQLHQYNLKDTDVSGNGLDCLINAIIQHSRYEYNATEFSYATTIRKEIQKKFPENNVTGMLHCDDECAKLILEMVNDTSKFKIYKVSVVIASSNGPIIYGGTCDKRYQSSGRHVVLWQQLHHYVSIVHKDFYDFICFQQNLIKKLFENEAETLKASDSFKITFSHLEELVKLQIVERINDDQKLRYRICEPLNEIIRRFEKDQSILQQESKHQVMAFLKKKLEVDFVTLKNSPRQLQCNTSAILFDDLRLHSVIKGIKIEQTAKKVKKYCQNMLSDSPLFTCDKEGDASAEYPIFFKLLLKYIEQCYRTPAADKTVRSSIMYSDFANFRKRNRLGEELKVLTDDMLSQSNLLHQLQLEDSNSLTNELKNAMTDCVNAIVRLRNKESDIALTLQCQVSCLLELKEPQISLRELRDTFKENVQEKGDVLGYFASDQCNYIIHLGEQKWSMMTLTTSACILFLGVTQISLGIALTLGGIPTFLPAIIGMGLIGEGIGDVIFGLGSLIAGYCNWKQYLSAKWKSVAISVAFGAIGVTAGAFLFSGTETVISRYAYKLFGTAKMSSKSLARTIGKKTIGKVRDRMVKRMVSQEIVELVKRVNHCLAQKARHNHLCKTAGNFINLVIDKFDALSAVNKELQESMKQAIIQYNSNNKKNDQESILRLSFRAAIKSSDFGQNIWTDFDHQTGGSQLEQQKAIESKSKALVKEMINILNKGSFSGTSLSEDIDITDDTVAMLIDEESQEMRSILMDELNKHKNSILSKNEELLQQLHEQLDIMFTTLHHHDAPRGRTAAIQGIQPSASQLPARSDNLRQYEENMKKLMSKTHSPKVLSKMIEHHAPSLSRNFVLKLVENTVTDPIRIVNEKSRCEEDIPNESVLKLHDEVNDDIIIHTKADSFKVAEEEFSSFVYAAALIVAPSSKRRIQLPYEIRSKLALKCCKPNHPYCKFITSGHACKYIEFELSDTVEFYFPDDVYKFLTAYGKNAQKLDCLETLQGTLNRKLLQTSVGLSVRNILSSEEISEKYIFTAFRTGNFKILEHLLLLIPSVYDVKKTSLFDDGGKEEFLEVYCSSNKKIQESYEKRVRTARDIIIRTTRPGDHDRLKILNTNNYEKLLSILTTSPANVYLVYNGNARRKANIKIDEEHKKRFNFYLQKIRSKDESKTPIMASPPTTSEFVKLQPKSEPYYNEKQNQHRIHDDKQYLSSAKELQQQSPAAVQNSSDMERSLQTKTDQVTSSTKQQAPDKGVKVSFLKEKFEAGKKVLANEVKIANKTLQGPQKAQHSREQ